MPGDDAAATDPAARYARYRDLLRAGHLAAIAGRHVAAIDAFREAAAIVPGRAVPFVAIGRSELTRGDVRAALAAFETALSFDAELAEALDGQRLASDRLAAAARRRMPSAPVTEPPIIGELERRWDEALEAQDVHGVLDAAMGLARLGRLAAAMTAARDCVRFAPKEPRVYRTMAWIQARERRDGGAFLTRQTDVFLDAIDVPDELEQRLGAAQAVDDVAAILAVAEDHRRHRRPRVALDIALEALRQAPGDPDVHLAIARARLALGMRGRALDDLDRLARLLAMRDDADGLDRLGSFVQDEVLRPQRVAWGPT